MTPVTILREAEIELWETVEFYEDRSVGLGLDFEKEVKAALELIREFPKRWPLRNDGTRRCLMHRFPYLVVYVCHKSHVWVVAFAHCKRRPGYWSGRVRKAGSWSEPRRR